MRFLGVMIAARGHLEGRASAEGAGGLRGAHAPGRVGATQLPIELGCPLLANADVVGETGRAANDPNRK